MSSTGILSLREGCVAVTNTVLPLTWQ